MPTWVTRRPPSAQNVATTTDLLTPPSLLVALGALRATRDGGYTLGPDPFDLDPTCSERMPWPTARTMWTVHEDGTAQDWTAHGEVWGNFPYGRELYSWLALLAAHGNGMALLYARTDTAGFHAHVWGRCDAVYFFAGRLFFHQPLTGHQCPANCGGPTVLACYGQASVERARRLLKPNSGYPGHLVPVSRGKIGKR